MSGLVIQHLYSFDGTRKQRVVQLEMDGIVRITVVKVIRLIKIVRTRCQSLQSHKSINGILKSSIVERERERERERVCVYTSILDGGNTTLILFLQAVDFSARNLSGLFFVRVSKQREASTFQRKRTIKIHDRGASDPVYLCLEPWSKIFAY